eukprot:evm.model.scf_307EXC.6 EVM.evm.TU.scf_307EXC.6   scf_307EXC:79590-85366(-)
MARCGGDIPRPTAGAPELAKDGMGAAAHRKGSQLASLLESATNATRFFRNLKHAGNGANRPAFVLLAVLLYSLMAVVAAYLAFVLLTLGTEWGNDQIWSRMADSMALRSSSVASRTTGLAQELLPGTMSRDVFHFWGGPLVMIMCSIALFYVPERRVVLAWLRPAGTVLGWELRRGWLVGWCGGVCAGEAAFLAFLLLRNVLTVEWIVRVVDEVFKAQKRAAEENGVALPYDDRHYEIDGVAFALGVASFQNLMWLFFPISRISPLFEAMGLPFEKRIRYHRWLGHFTLAILSIHGGLYWILWAREGGREWKTQALDWTPFSARGTGINHLAGAISLGFGLALWFTALEWVRTHLVSFIGFLVFAVLHAPGMHIYLSAGLLLYCLDLVLRLIQLSTPVEVRWSATTSDKSIAVLGLENTKSLCPLSTLFINAPQLSKFQWHPVTPVCNGGSEIKICFKGVGKWTKGLVRRAGAQSVPYLKVNGPYHAPTLQGVRTLQHHEWVVMIVGGAAITPLLTLLKHLAAHAQPVGAHQRGDSALDVPVGRVACPRGVVVVWSVRSIADAELMNEELYAFSRRHPGFMDLRIHCTGKASVGEWEGRLLGEWGSAEIQPVDGDRKAREGGAGKAGGFEGSRWLRRLSPRALPLHMGGWHLAAMYVVLYSGAFMGLMLGMGYRLEILRASAAVLRGKVDVVAVLSIFLMAMGLVTLFAFPAHLLMYLDARRSARHRETLESGGSRAPAAPRLSPASVRWISENWRAGRPVIGDVLDGVMRELTPGNTAAVFTGGGARRHGINNFHNEWYKQVL